MKKLVGFLYALIAYVAVIAQVPTYYNDVNLTLTGMALKSELSQKIINTHTNILLYNNLWSTLQLTDLDPTNSNNVLLIYGYNDTDSNPVSDRTRNKTNNGGNNGQWNREHTYAKSLGTPDLGNSGPGADAHHVRSCDVQTNNNRGSKKFAAGSGNAGTIGANWYPGNEWKGDVARMMMYMYLRYPSQCLPNNVGVGTSIAVDPAMIDLFLQWNAEDNVSTYETNRNNILESQQGNRNPFIDNPYLATLIWGGTMAQDTWNMTSTAEYVNDLNVKIFPVPSNDGSFTIFFNNDVHLIEVFTISGQKIKSYQEFSIHDKKVMVNDLQEGLYFVTITTTNQKRVTRKVVVN